MRSESTSAFGQPRETNPTLGTALRAATSGLVGLALVFVFAGRRKAGEGKSREHVASLVLHLLLELREHLLALLDVGLHQALHRRPLQVHELRPELLGGAGMVAVNLLRLFVQRPLDVLERLDVELEVCAYNAMHGVAVSADELHVL